MNEKEISSISLASLVAIYPPQPEDLYYDGCILGHREVLDTEEAMSLFRFPTRINAFGVVFCSKGSVTVTSNLKHCVVESQTLFVCPPRTIIQVESQEEASVHFILCEEEFLSRIQIDLKQMMHLFMAVRENPCLPLSREELDEILGEPSEPSRQAVPKKDVPPDAEIPDTEVQEAVEGIPAASADDAAPVPVQE